MHFSVFIFKAASFTCVIASPLQRPHLWGYPTAQPCAGSALSSASGLIRPGNRSSQLIDIYFALPYRRHGTTLRRHGFILAPARWRAFNNSGTGAVLFLADASTKSSIVGFASAIAAGHFWDVALFFFIQFHF